ncbi:MAG: uracil-DNA glycosylase [Nitrososphaeria archaeon]
MAEDTWQLLDKEIIGCARCPRIVEWRTSVARNPPRRFKGNRYWCKPLTGFGDKNASILIVGLAPAAHGGNRTGRMFTGDDSGKTLMEVLYDVGLANQPYSTSLGDGLVLTNAFITAVLKCAPPNNRPTADELKNCRPFLLRELHLLRNVRVMVCLGHVAYENLLRTCRLMKLRVEDVKFSHGASCKLLSKEGIQLTVLASYHPSRQNVQTGRLKTEMLKQIFRKAVDIVGKA